MEHESVSKKILDDIENEKMDEYTNITKVDESLDSNTYDEVHDEDDEVVSAVEPGEPYYIKPEEPDGSDVIISDGDSVSQNNTDQPHDIGIFGTARGIERPYAKYSRIDFTSINNPNKEKILKIKTIADFDTFTSEYGDLYPYKLNVGDTIENKYFLFIKWDKVAAEYKGFYINEGLASDRFNMAYFKDNLYDSWWSNEYMVSNANVVIFIDDGDTKYVNATISNPFEGKIYDHKEFPIKEYVKWSDKSNKQMILTFDIKGFDKFSNKYGYISKSKTILIKWKEVSTDWKGIYFDKFNNADLFLNRHKYAFYNGNKYKSWWSNYGLKMGIVYIFD